jgi:hypothetical protein
LAPRIFLPKDYAERTRLQTEQRVGQDGKLDLQFVLTRLSVARAALASASAYASGLEARITILAPQVVPYPLPLDEPPVQTAILENTLGALAAEQPVETAVEIYLCRDRWETMQRVLKPESIVMISRRNNWWLFPEVRFVSALRKAGHRVVYV